MPKAGSSKPGYYAVHRGHQPGVYSTWPEAQAQVSGFRGAVHRKCPTRQEAESFVRTGQQAAAVPVKTKSWSQPQLSTSSLNSAPVARAPTRRVYTDGSCRGNGQHGAVAGIGVYWPDEDSSDLAERLPGLRQTNQRAELWAVMRALETDPAPSEALDIQTDSSYAIDCLTKWHLGWARNGWFNVEGQAVSNADLIRHTLALIKARPSEARIVFTHVRGHQGDVGNTRADRLANEGALKPAQADVVLSARPMPLVPASDIDPSWLLDDAALQDMGERQSF